MKFVWKFINAKVLTSAAKDSCSFFFLFFFVWLKCSCYYLSCLKIRFLICILSWLVCEPWSINAHLFFFLGPVTLLPNAAHFLSIFKILCCVWLSPALSSSLKIIGETISLFFPKTCNFMQEMPQFWFDDYSDTVWHTVSRKIEDTSSS